MTHVIGSELFKLRTTRTFLALVGAAVAIVLVAAILICAFVNFSGEDQPNEILAVILGPVVRALALVIGILAVTNEFRHGTITPTLLVVPDRTRLMLAKLIAVLGLALGLGFVTGLIMIASSAIFGALRDFEAPDALAVLLGSTFATALNAALGVGVGVLVRNQVGAIVGILIYGFILEDLIGLIPGVRDFLPKYGLGGVSNALGGAGDAFGEDVLSQPAAGALLALYVVVVWVIGLLVMRRRDVTA